MKKVPITIYENCPECDLRSDGKTVFNLLGECDEVKNEYLYNCSKCGARLWVKYAYARENEAKSII